MSPLNREDRSNKGCLKDRPKLKIALTVLIPIILLLLIILLAIFLRSGNGVCNTDFCKEQTNRLKRGMNLSVNPCDNFYEFVCGNVLNDSNRKNLYVELNDKTNRDLLKLYKEEIKDSEHKMVKIAKRLFQQCMNLDVIERDGITGIKDVIDKVGRWPVLENRGSIERKKFDWVQATYKLRELGYPFSVFLDVDVAREKENKEKFYLKIAISSTRADEMATMRDNSQSEAVEVMMKVANLFGAKTNRVVVGEMANVYNLWQRTPRYTYGSTEKYTVEQLQIEYDKGNRKPFNWLEFLRKLVEPQIVLSSNNYILVEDLTAVSDWVNTVLATSERTVGNYMIWKLIENQLPYLPKNLQNITKYSIKDTREEFCIKLVDQRFLINPIKVINTRNVIPEENQKEVQEIFSNIKSEFLNLFEKTNWMDDEDKRKTTKNTKTLTLIYGLPQDYLHDKILDDMEVDLTYKKASTFLDLLAQTNRNLQTTLFKQIILPASSTTGIMSRPYVIHKLYKPVYSHPYYNRMENEIFVPAQLAYNLQGDAPRYLRYSIIGNLLGSFFTTVFIYYDVEFRDVITTQLSHKTANQTSQLMMCLKDQTEKYNLFNDSNKLVSSLEHIVGEKVSYQAYEKSIQSKGEEKLPELNYTSRQLFWIVGTYCHVPVLLDHHSPFNKVSFHSNVTVISKLNNPYFAKDFNCPEGTETNPAHKCPLLL